MKGRDLITAEVTRAWFAQPEPPVGPGAIEKAYRLLDVQRRGYVPIHAIRRLSALGPEFNEALRVLRRELQVHLEVGDPGDYCAREVEGGYSDPDGTLYLTCSWTGER